MKIPQGFAISSIFLFCYLSYVESTLRLPQLNYGWFGNTAKNRGTRTKRYNPKIRPTPSSLSLATFDPSPQIYPSQSHSGASEQHHSSYDNNFKRETYPGSSRKPQHPYGPLTPPPGSVVTNPKQLSDVPNHYPTTLQLLTDFNSVEIPASVSIRSNRYKKHNNLYADEQNLYDEHNEVAYPDYFLKQPDFLESPKKENEYEHDYHSAYIPLKNENIQFPSPTRPPRIEFSTKSYSYSSNTNNYQTKSHSQPQTLGQLQSQTPSRPLTLGHMPSFGDFLKSDFTTIPKKRNVQPNQYQYQHDEPSHVPNEHSYTHQERDSFPYSHVKSTPRPTEEDYSYGSSEAVGYPETGNQGPKSSSFIHNSAFETFKNRNKKQISHQSQFTSPNEIPSENNEQSYSAGFTAEGATSPFGSFGQSFRQKRKPAGVDHQKQPQTPANPYGNYADQSYETYPTSYEQDDYSDPGNYQYSHQNQPETGYVNLPHTSNYHGGSFDENTSPSPYGDKFAQSQAQSTPSHYSEQHFPVQYETTIAPYADKFPYKNPTTTPSPVTTNPPAAYSPHSYISNEVSQSQSQAGYPRPPRQSSHYEHYEASTKRNIVEYHGYDGYEEHTPDVYNHHSPPTPAANHYDHSQYPDYSQNEVSNYPTTVAPKIRFETSKPYVNSSPKPNPNRHKKHISGVASSSYSSSSSPHYSHQTIVDHNDIIPAEEEAQKEDERYQHFDDYSNPTFSSNNIPYSGDYDTNRQDEYSDYYETDPLYSRPSEAKNVEFAGLHAQTRNRNAIALSTSKGFDQDLDSLKDMDPLQRLHAIARGETVDEIKPTNSRYEENSLSDKYQRVNQRIDYFDTPSRNLSYINHSSIETDFTSFGRRKRSRKPIHKSPSEAIKPSSFRNTPPTRNTNKRNTPPTRNVNKRRRQRHNTAEALSNYLKSKQRAQQQNKQESKEDGFADYHNDYDHDHEEGCTTDDGRYYQGGDTWDVPGCARAVCAKVLEGGWQIAVDRCTTIRQNPQYLCVFEENKELNFPECCPRAVQCRDNL